MDEAFYRQLEAASCLQTLALMGDFNQPDMCRRDNTAEHKQSRRFLECTDDAFLTQVIEKLKKETCSAGPNTSLQGGVCWGCESQRLPWLQRPWYSGVQNPKGKQEGKKQAHKPGVQVSRTWTLQTLAWKHPMGQGPEGKRGSKMLVSIQGSPPWKLKSSIPTKSGKNARRPVWINKKLLAKFKHKK